MPQDICNLLKPKTFLVLRQFCNEIVQNQTGMTGKLSQHLSQIKLLFIALAFNFTKADKDSILYDFVQLYFIPNLKGNEVLKMMPLCRDLFM